MIERKNLTEHFYFAMRALSMKLTVMKRSFWGCLLLGLIVLSLHASPSSRGTYGQRVVAAVLMAEAWSEGRKGMTAVAEVIRKRADEWGISPLAVVKRVKHFSCLNSTSPSLLVKKFHRKSDFEIALDIARTAYNTPQKLPGFARGATHFHDHSVTPYWTSGHKPVAIIGKLSFYRLPI